MRAMELAEPGDLGAGRGQLVPRDRPVPAPQADEVLIEVAACAVCRTDLQIAEGDLPARKLPIVPGHQVVGRIAECGAEGDRTRIGELVGVAWLASACGTCRFCAGGRENLCEQAQFTGWTQDGGYATHLLARAGFAYPLASVVGDGGPEAIAPLLCGGVIGYRSLRIAGVSSASRGLRLGLYGYGASASLVLPVARYWGCDVYVVTRSETEAQRAIMAGAQWAGTYESQVPVRLDAAITFAPAGDVVIAALKALDRGGIVAINAIHLDRVPQFSYDDLWLERSLRSVANVTRRDVREFLDLVPLAGIRTSYEVLPLSEANAALQRVRAGDVRGSFVLRP